MIELPNSRTIFMPQVPEKFKDVEEMRLYLKQLVDNIEQAYAKTFDNIYTLSSVVTT